VVVEAEGNVAEAAEAEDAVPAADHLTEAVVAGLLTVAVAAVVVDTRVAAEVIRRAETAAGLRAAVAVRTVEVVQAAADTLADRTVALAVKVPPKDKRSGELKVPETIAPQLVAAKALLQAPQTAELPMAAVRVVAKCETRTAILVVRETQAFETP
jgi:hypothetical protein